ncbi:hypothetical protein Fot_36969 [Forsythia ovata]|uniref:Uncharacterized protein n=1 Tax=Forsythia ovata TaxID=205694 RepID=A0ABD1SQX2_9LAMI
MNTPTRRFTRSLTKRESPGKVAKTASYLPKNVIYLDTPTPTKDSNNDQSIGTQRRMSSCVGKESPGNPFLKEIKFCPTIVLSSGSKKNKDSHGFEPKVDLPSSDWVGQEECGRSHYYPENIQFHFLGPRNALLELGWNDKQL